MGEEQAQERATHGNRFYIPNSIKGKVMPQVFVRVDKEEEKRQKESYRKKRNKLKNNWRIRTRIDYNQLEQAKLLVDSIVYRKNIHSGAIQELRINILPWSRLGYIDIRFYNSGKSTGRGALIHLDHLDALTAAIIQAGRTVDQLKRSGVLREEATEPMPKMR